MPLLPVWEETEGHVPTRRAGKAILPWIFNMPGRKITSYYRKRKSPYTMAAKPIVKKRRVQTPSNAMNSGMNIDMVYRGMFILDFLDNACVDKKLILADLLDQQQQDLVKAFATGKLKYAVFKIHNIILSGNAVTVGAVAGAVLDGTAPPACTGLNALVNQAPSAKPMSAGSLAFSSQTVNFMYKPVQTTEKTYLDTPELLSKLYGTIRVAHNGQVTNNSSVCMEYYVKIAHKRN